MAVTRLHWRDYAIGTFIGMIPVVTVWVLLGEVLGEVSESIVRYSAV